MAIGVGAIYSSSGYLSNNYFDVDYFDLVGTLLVIPVGSVYYNFDYLSPVYFDADYFDLVGSNVPFSPILTYWPPTGSTISITDHPYAIFDPTIQSGTIFFGLQQSGNINVPTSTVYFPLINEDILYQQFPLNTSNVYTATISGTAANGPFSFSWSFFTNSNQHGGGGGGHKKHFKITFPGGLLKPTYSLVVDTQ